MTTTATNADLAKRLVESLHLHAHCFADVIEAQDLAVDEYAYGGGLALTVTLTWNDEGMEYPERTTLSTNLIDYGMIPEEGHFYVKDYSEHSGLARALEAAGIVEIVGRVPIGYGHGWVVKLTKEASKLCNTPQTR